jgi:hypothetical protein
MAREYCRDVSWFRRPRRPWRFLDHPLAWPHGIFWLCVIFLAGLGVVTTEEAWWAKAGGSLAILVSVAVVVLVVANLARPVARRESHTTPSADLAAADLWAAALDSDGYVDIAFNKRGLTRVIALVVILLVMAGLGTAWLLTAGLLAAGPLILGFAGLTGMVVGAVGVMLVGFAFLPHLEVATAAGPAVRVDSRGIRIARWHPLEIPWTDVLAVRAHASTGDLSNVVVEVTDAFYEAYQASRPYPLRLVALGFIDDVNTAVIGCGFAIPATIDANPAALADWLETEALLRNPRIDQ